MPPEHVIRFTNELEREFLPYLSVDNVIFGLRDGLLRVLLRQLNGTERWSLPGGYVRRRQSVDDAAAEVAQELTGISGVPLRQFHTFGDTARGEAAIADSLRAAGINLPADHWIFGRVVSVGYVALVNADRVVLQGTPWGAAVEWCPVTELPPLIIDHASMIAHALTFVRERIDEIARDGRAITEPFTMPEVQRLHETVLGRALDRRNFQKRLLEGSLLERLPDLRVGGRRKATYTYRWARRTG